MSVTYVCKVRKYGTLVYRPTSDLRTLLSEAIWKLTQDNQHIHVETMRSMAVAGEHACTTDTCNIGHINKFVRAQIESYLGTHEDAYDELNMGDQIANIDQLWNAMYSLTQSKSEMRGTSKVFDPISPAYHVKKSDCFLYCVPLCSS